jgi:ABC-type transport system involved in multi-copper enzyme maturation permease subunit
MIPGPVFHAELLTTARRARYYAIRFAYGMILLFFVVQTVGEGRASGNALWQGSEISIADMAATGQAIFLTIAVFQAVAVLVLTPALVAGAVADEKQRKTLPYLMASRLSGTEIILGKLLSRFLHVGILLAVGLPVMSLISLFGGVEPALVLLVYAGTLSTAWFLAALAILVSTLSRRPREANAQVYILELAWLFGPALVAVLLARGGGVWLSAYQWIGPVNDVLRRSSPYAIVEAASGDLANAMAWMIALQATAGLGFVLVAIALLRPLARLEGDQARRRGGLFKKSGRKPWMRYRPALEDDAMLWKERHATWASAIIRLEVGFLAIVAGAMLVYTGSPYVAEAFIELWQHGYSADAAYGARAAFSIYLRVACTLLYAAWCLVVASLAAGAVVGEREQDTWTSLVATPLGGDEILRAKLLGVLWRTRGFGVALLVLWLLGVASGAVHPLGLAAVALETAVFVWFAAALGIWCSLAATSGARAQAATMAILIALNGLYLVCCIPLRPTWFFTSGVTPLIEAISLLSYEQISWLFTNSDRANELEALFACVLGVVLYAVAAAALTTQAMITFDAAIDRPRRGVAPDAPHREVPVPMTDRPPRPGPL